MDVRSMPPTNAAAGATSVVGTPPRLGAPVPGTTGGLPALGGLSVLRNPMAQELQSMGRGEDSMLIHMTPSEVGGLQQLAMAAGGSLTINPYTGLPEAGFLGKLFKKLIPTIAGGLLAATGVGAPLAAAAVGLGSTALTGSLQKGLLAGLGAWGGASLAGAAGLGGKISSNLFGALSSNPGFFGANMGAGLGSLSAAGANTPVLTNAGREAITQAGSSGILNPQLVGVTSTAAPAIQSYTAVPALDALKTAGTTAASTGAASGAATAAGTAANSSFVDKFANAARTGLPSGTPAFIARGAPYAAGLGVLNTATGAFTPSGIKTRTGAIDNSYQGPYYSQRRNVVLDATREQLMDPNAKIPARMFDVAVPEIYNAQGQIVQAGSSTKPGTPIIQAISNPKAKKNEAMYTFVERPFVPPGSLQQEEEQELARGGEVDMRDGSFVLDARTVSELGNGSSNAGIELLSRLGGRPLNGPGDGVSDSIPARIGGRQKARVARDEVIMPPEAVRRIGKGNPKRGADKLYALMDKAHKARKHAERGQDTRLRKGLA